MKKNVIMVLSLVILLGLLMISFGCQPAATTPATTAKPATTSATPATTAKPTTTSATPATTAKPTTTSATPAPQYGGILKVIFTRTPASIGYPPDVKGTGHRVTVPCLESLFRLDNQARPTPWLVESWELAPDKNSYTFHLRKGVKFHDGTDFNAEAVKWNLEEIRKKNSELAIITSMDVLDTYTVRLNLKEYSNQLFTYLAERCGVMGSPTAIKNNGVDWALTHPVGTGPFEFVSFQRDVSVKYKKFNNYWQKGKPYLDGIEYSFVVDATMAAMSFQAGEAQIFGQVPPVQAASLKGKGYEIVTGKGVVSFISGDSANSNSPFADQRVREAVEYAIDRAAIADGLGLGFNTAINQLCPPGYFAYNPDKKGRLFDPGKAKQLLTAAGYPNGFGFQIPLIAQQTAGQEFLVSLQKYLRDVGINAQIQIESVPKWNEWVYNGWKNGLIWGDCVLYDDCTQTLLQSFAPSKTAGAKYVSCLRPPEYEALLAKASAASNHEEHVQLTKDAFDKIYDFAMLNPIWVKKEIVVTLPSVHDHNLLKWSVDRWDPESVWLSK